MVTLSSLDLSIAAGLVLLVAALSFYQRLNIERQLLISALRTFVQLFLIGFVLVTLFKQSNVVWVVLMALVMAAVASYEILARQRHLLRAAWSYGIGAISLFLSSFAVTLIALTTIINTQPWWLPQYSIPLLGMVLGNTMTSIALALDNLTTSAWQQREMIEQRLVLGHTKLQAIATIYRDSMRTGMLPIINAMAIAGVVSLPGMMTGQILAGVSPLEAAKYQILIMFLIAAAAGFGTLLAIRLTIHRLFDHRHRLRLDRLTSRN